MTDEARLKRLTELARQVWPEVDSVVASTEMAAGVHERGGEERLLAMLLCHPRALDALEAALLVLAGEPSPEYVRGKTEALRELQRACVAHGGILDDSTNTIIDADELERRIEADRPGKE